jgi:hypothetical protein
VDDVDDTAAATMRQAWIEAERRLYPLATSAPRRYEQVIRVVRAVADDLRTVASTRELHERWRDAPTMVSRVVDERGLKIGDLSREHIAGAAFSLRHGELAAVEQRRAQEDRVRAARSAGLDWVVLHERGDLDAGLLDPYRAIEMHLATGLALVTTVEVDPASGGPSYVLAAAQLDAVTGDVVDADPGIVEWTEHSCVGDLLAVRPGVVELIESLDAGDRRTSDRL